MRKVSYEIGLPIGSRAKLGLIVLQADETIEYEFWQLISKLDLALHVSRIPSNSKVSKDGLMAMKNELSEAASLFPEKIRFNVVGYACTSASSIIGSKVVSDMIRKGCTTQEVCNPISALIAACKQLKINDLLFLTPYITDVSEHLIEEVNSNGIRTTVTASFDEKNEASVARIRPTSIVDAVNELYSGQSAIFISCTNLQTFTIIEEIEKKCGCICFSSNQVLIWQMLRLAEIDHNLRGYGKLLSKS